MFAIQGMCAHKVEPLQRHECTHTRHDTQLSLNAIKEGRNLVVFNENASNKLKTNIKINNILFSLKCRRVLTINGKYGENRMEICHRHPQSAFILHESYAVYAVIGLCVCAFIRQQSLVQVKMKRANQQSQ